MTAGRAAGARQQVARLLMLVPYLHTRDHVRLDEAAAALGVSRDQLVADLRVLLMCGLPGGYPDDLIDVDLDALEDSEGDGVIRVSNADYLARPLRLTPTEASALIVALRTLAQGTPEPDDGAVDRVLAKLEGAVAEGAPVGQVAFGDQVDPLAQVRGRLLDAVRRQRQVRIGYYVPSRDEESERVVDPRGVVAAAGAEYLDGWCHRAQAPRLFRLDRIRQLNVLRTRVPPLPGTPGKPRNPGKPRTLSRGALVAPDGTRTVTLRLAPAAAWVPEYYAVETVRRRRGGVVEVTMRVADSRWLVRLLLRLAGSATVVEPEELAATVRDMATDALGLYGPRGSMVAQSPS